MPPATTTLLIVEPSGKLGTKLQRSLRAHAVVARVAKDADTALAALAGGPMVWLVDLSLPSGGIALLQEARNLSSDSIATIGMSDDAALRDEATRAVAIDEVVTKPPRIAELAQLVTKLAHDAHQRIKRAGSLPPVRQDWRATGLRLEAVVAMETGERLDVVVADLSSSGAGVSGLADVPSGRVLTLLLPVGDGRAELPGLVARPGLGGAPVGVRFRDLDEDASAALETVLAPYYENMKGEAVLTPYGPMALSAAGLQTSLLYERLGLPPDCGAEQLRVAATTVLASLDRSIEQARGKRRLRLESARHELARMDSLWLDPRARAAYDFRWELPSVDMRLADAAAGLGPGAGELRELWAKAFPKQAEQAEAMLANKPPVTDELIEQLRTLQPFHELLLAGRREPDRFPVSVQPAPSPTMAVVRGSLADLPVIDIVQAVAEAKAETELFILRGSEAVGAVATVEEEIVGAFFGRETGEGAFHKLMLLTDGDFVVRYGPPRSLMRNIQGASVATLLRQASAARAKGSPPATPTSLDPRLVEDIALHEPQQLDAVTRARIEAAEGAAAEASVRALLEAEEREHLAEVLRKREQMSDAERAEAQEREAALEREREFAEEGRLDAELRREVAEREAPRRSARAMAGLALVVGVTVGLAALAAMYRSEDTERQWRARFAAAVEAADSGDVSRAISALESLRAENETHPLVHRQLGDAYARGGDRAASLAAYEKYLSLATDTEDVSHVRALVETAKR